MAAVAVPISNAVAVAVADVIAVLPRDVFDRLRATKSDQGQDSDAANDWVEDNNGGDAQWEDDNGAHSRNNSNKPGAATFAP